jgi:hypothetical protein
LPWPACDDVPPSSLSGLSDEATVTRRLSLLFLAFASPLVLFLFWLPWSGAEVLFALLVAAYPVALIAIAVSHDGSIGPLRQPLLLLLFLLEGSTIAMLVLRGHVLTAPWVAGLPLSAAIQIFGVWLAPLLVVGLGYALTFDRYELRQEDLDRLTRLAGGGPDRS